MLTCNFLKLYDDCNGNIGDSELVYYYNGVDSYTWADSYISIKKVPQ